jgi:hypothetical protein
MELRGLMENGSWRVLNATIAAADLLHASSIYTMATAAAG